MTETEKDRLLRLYKLLWEQIKDEDVTGLFHETSLMVKREIISKEEKNILDGHILECSSKLTEPIYCKAFVQRMIKELENDK